MNQLRLVVAYFHSYGTPPPRHTATMMSRNFPRVFNSTWSAKTFKVSAGRPSGPTEIRFTNARIASSTSYLDYATATTARCAPPARVLKLDRLLHPHLPPHLSHDCSLKLYVAGHIPSPAPIAAYPMRPRLSPQRFDFAHPSLSSSSFTPSTLLWFAGTRSQLHTARSQFQPGGTQRHLCLRYKMFLSY